MSRRAARAIAVALALAALGTAGAAPPTYLFEWVSRSKDTAFRLTLFRDRTLVRKTELRGVVDFHKRLLSKEEYAFYVSYLGSAEARGAAGDYRSGLTGDAVAQSEIRVAPPGGTEWELEFDSMSALSFPAERIRSALEGLRDSIGKVLPPESEFAPDRIPPGTILRRRDGVAFRVVAVDSEKKTVELHGVDVPLSEILPIADLRLYFHPPSPK